MSDHQDLKELPAWAPLVERYEAGQTGYAPFAEDRLPRDLMSLLYLGDVEAFREKSENFPSPLPVVHDWKKWDRAIPVLHAAVSTNQVSMVRLLLGRGERVDNDTNPYLLLECFRQNNPDMMQLLLDNGYCTIPLDWSLAESEKPNLVEGLTVASWWSKKGLDPFFGHVEPKQKEAVFSEWMRLARTWGIFEVPHALLSFPVSQGLLHQEWAHLLEDRSTTLTTLMKFLKMGLVPPDRIAWGGTTRGMITVTLSAIGQERGGGASSRSSLLVSFFLASPVHTQVWLEEWAEDPCTQGLAFALMAEGGLALMENLVALEERGFSMGARGNNGETVLEWISRYLEHGNVVPVLRRMAHHWGDVFFLPDKSGKNTIFEQITKSIAAKGEQSVELVDFAKALPDLCRTRFEALPEATQATRSSRRL